MATAAAPSTARVVRFHATGGPEVLKIETEPIPEPSEGEVRLRVKAIGLNRAEIMFREGRYLEPPAFPAKLGYEAAGVVDAVGPDVDKSWLGKKVSTMPAFVMTKYGVYGEVAIVPVSAIAVYPDKLTPEQGTSIWMQYLTAYGGLVEYGKVTKGDFVVLTAASSSVGIAAIEIVNVEGATSIATTRTAKKKKALMDAGAKHVIVTEEEDFLTRVKEITGGKGPRVIFDPIGGKGIEQLAQAAAYHGTIFEYGALAPEPTPFPLFAALDKGLTVRGYTLREIFPNPKLRAKAQKYVFDHVKKGDFKPKIVACSLSHRLWKRIDTWSRTSRSAKSSLACLDLTQISVAPQVAFRPRRTMLDTLKVASAIELGRGAGMYESYLRGEAFLMLHDGKAGGISEVYGAPGTGG
jgi:NADPH:quinone reductase-like Zn-dependent oxidoreductase